MTAPNVQRPGIVGKRKKLAETGAGPSDTKTGLDDRPPEPKPFPWGWILVAALAYIIVND